MIRFNRSCGVPGVLLALTVFVSHALATTTMTDEEVRVLLGECDDYVARARIEGATRHEAHERAREWADDLLPIESMSPRQIAMVHRHPVTTFMTADRRRRVIERLETFANHEGLDGAITAVLRLELIGSVTWEYRPDQAMQKALLDEALSHPALPAALRLGEEIRLVHAVRSLANTEVWHQSREQIIAIQNHLNRSTHYSIALDCEAYYRLIDKLLEPGDGARQQIRDRINAYYADVLQRSDAGEITMKPAHEMQIRRMLAYQKRSIT